MTTDSLANELLCCVPGTRVWVSLPAGNQGFQPFEITSVQLDGHPAGGTVIHIKPMETQNGKPTP